MNVGMLWFDNNPRTTPEAKIANAAEYYQKKYGQCPNLVFVHPSTLTGHPVINLTIDVRESRSVMPNHFWMGINLDTPTLDTPELNLS